MLTDLFVAAFELRTQHHAVTSKLGSSYKETSHCKVKLDQKLYYSRIYLCRSRGTMQLSSALYRTSLSRTVICSKCLAQAWLSASRCWPCWPRFRRLLHVLLSNKTGLQSKAALYSCSCTCNAPTKFHVDCCLHYE